MLTCYVSIIKNISFQYVRWLVNCLTVSATLPLFDLSVGVEIVISLSGHFPD